MPDLFDRAQERDLADTAAALKARYYPPSPPRQCDECECMTLADDLVRVGDREVCRECAEFLQCPAAPGP